MRSWHTQDNHNIKSANQIQPNINNIGPWVLLDSQRAKKRVSPRPYVSAKLHSSQNPQPNTTHIAIRAPLYSNIYTQDTKRILMTKISFPHHLYFETQQKQPVWTRIKSRIEAHEWDSWPLTFKIDSKLDFFKNPTRLNKHGGDNVMILIRIWC